MTHALEQVGELAAGIAIGGTIVLGVAVGTVAIMKRIVMPVRR